MKKLESIVWWTTRLGDFGLFFDIFQDIDTAAQSSLGSEYLYSNPPATLRQIRNLMISRSHLAQHPEVRGQLQLLFSEIGKKITIKRRNGSINQLKLITVFTCFLASIPLLSPFLYFINPSLGYIVLHHQHGSILRFCITPWPRAGRSRCSWTAWAIWYGSSILVKTPACPLAPASCFWKKQWLL